MSQTFVKSKRRTLSSLLDLEVPPTSRMEVPLVRFKLHTYLCQTSFFFDSRLKQKRWAHSMRNIASNNHFPFPLFWHVWDDRFLGQLPPIDRKIGRVDMTWFRAVGAKVLLKNKRKKLTYLSKGPPGQIYLFRFMEELR